MSHVDEGSLHAYLDGALDEYPTKEALRVREHLAACASCSARLEEERRVRETAAAILAEASPRIDAPPLEELRARATARGPRVVPGPLRRLHRFGWAASVVLAVGVGWALRGRQVESPGPALTPADAQLAAESAAGPESEDAADQLRAPLLETADVGPAERVAGAEGAGRQQAEVDEAEAPLAPRQTRLAAADLDAPPAELEAPPTVVAMEADLLDRPVERIDASKLALDRVLPDAVRAELAVRPSPSAAGDEPPAETRERPAREAGQVALLRSSVSAPSTAVQAVGQTTPRSEETRPSHRRTLEDRRSDESGAMLFPDLTTLEFAWFTEGHSESGTRILQLLASGDTLELIHLPEGIDPSTVPEAADGRSELVVRRGDGWLVMRAPLELEELEALLDRLDAIR